MEINLFANAERHIPSAMFRKISTVFQYYYYDINHFAVLRMHFLKLYVNSVS